MSTARSRTPNFLRFIVTGAVIGLLAGVLVAIMGEAAPSYSPGSQISFFGVLFAGVGALLAALVAVLLDRLP